MKLTMQNQKWYLNINNNVLYFLVNYEEYLKYITRYD